MHSITHSNASISTWKGEREARIFFAPIKSSNPYKVLYHPWPEKISFSFQKPSVKHYLPGIDGRIVVFTCGVLFWLFNICTSAQSFDFISASLRVSRGSTSRLLKTLLYLLFQMYHSIYANWWWRITDVNGIKVEDLFCKIFSRLVYLMIFFYLRGLIT